MTDTNQASEDEKLARLFHDTYERLAPAFSYKTRKASAVPWAEVPPNNKGLMIAVAHAVNALTRTEKLKLLDRLSSHQEYLFWWTGGEYEKTKAVDMRAISAERDKLTKLEAEV